MTKIAKNPKTSSRKSNQGDDEFDITDDDRYSDVKSAIEEYIEQEANQNAAVSYSYVHDEPSVDAEEEGFDPETVINIAEFGYETAVDGDILVPPHWIETLGLNLGGKNVVTWRESLHAPHVLAGRSHNAISALHDWMSKNGYERIPVGSRVPTGAEAEISVDHLVSHLHREHGWPAEFIDAVVEHVYNDDDFIYTSSESGDSWHYAKPLEGREENPTPSVSVRHAALAARLAQGL